MYRGQPNYLQRGLGIYNALNQFDQDRTQRREAEEKRQREQQWDHGYGLLAGGATRDDLIAQGIPAHLADQIHLQHSETRQKSGVFEDSEKKRQAEAALYENVAQLRAAGKDTVTILAELAAPPEGVDARAWDLGYNSLVKELQVREKTSQEIHQHRQEESAKKWSSLQYAARETPDDEFAEFITNGPWSFVVDHAGDGTFIVSNRDPVAADGDDTPIKMHNGDYVTREQLMEQAKRFYESGQFQAAEMQRVAINQEAMDKETVVHKDGQGYRATMLLGPDWQKMVRIYTPQGTVDELEKDLEQKGWNTNDVEMAKLKTELEQARIDSTRVQGGAGGLEKPRSFSAADAERYYKRFLSAIPTDPETYEQPPDTAVQAQAALVFAEQVMNSTDASSEQAVGLVLQELTKGPGWQKRIIEQLQPPVPFNEEETRAELQKLVDSGMPVRQLADLYKKLRPEGRLILKELMAQKRSSKGNKEGNDAPEQEKEKNQGTFFPERWNVPERIGGLVDKTVDTVVTPPWMKLPRY